MATHKLLMLVFMNHDEGWFRPFLPGAVVYAVIVILMTGIGCSKPLLSSPEMKIEVTADRVHITLDAPREYINFKMQRGRLPYNSRVVFRLGAAKGKPIAQAVTLDANLSSQTFSFSHDVFEPGENTVFMELNNDNYTPSQFSTYRKFTLPDPKKTGAR